MRVYEGLITAMVTPFSDDGSVSEESAVRLGRYLLSNGSDGIVVAGTTGESATLTEDEHLDLLRLLIGELSGEGAVIASTGSNNTKHAAAMTARAIEYGADAILSVTPYYNKPNRAGIIAHYKEIARAAQGVPIILYNIPARTALNLAPDMLAELAQIDGIEAVKQANADELQPVDGLTVLAGDDTSLAQTMIMGGGGGICVASHLVGAEMKKMVDEPETAADIARDLCDLFAVLSITTNPIPVKAALDMLGHDVGKPRLPLVEADEAQQCQIRAVLERSGLLTGATAA